MKPRKSKIIAKFTATIEVPFWVYPNERLNKRAIAHIKKWIQDTLNYELKFIPLFVEKDTLNGGFIEDSSYQTTIRVK